MEILFEVNLIWWLGTVERNVQVSWERHQLSKYGSIPNNSYSPQLSCSLINAYTPLWSAKCIFPSKANLYTFILNLLPCPLLPPLLPLTFNLNIYCHSHDKNVLSPQHMDIPMNTICHKKMIYCFLQTQHQKQILRSFSIFELCSTHCSYHWSLCPSLNFHIAFIQAPCFTSMQHCWLVYQSSSCLCFLFASTKFGTFLTTVTAHNHSVFSQVILFCNNYRHSKLDGISIFIYIDYIYPYFAE